MRSFAHRSMYPYRSMDSLNNQTVMNPTSTTADGFEVWSAASCLLNLFPPTQIEPMVNFSFTPHRPLCLGQLNLQGSKYSSQSRHHHLYQLGELATASPVMPRQISQTSSSITRGLHRRNTTVSTVSVHSRHSTSQTLPIAIQTTTRSSPQPRTILTPQNVSEPFPSSPAPH